MILGMEVGRAYSELNDPVEQYTRLISQKVSRDEAYDLDEESVQSVAHRMPPAGGTGLGMASTGDRAACGVMITGGHPVVRGS